MEGRIKEWIQLDKRRRALFLEMQAVAEHQRKVEQAIFQQVPKDQWKGFQIGLTSGKRIYMCEETTFLPISHTLLRTALQSWNQPFDPKKCFEHILQQRQPKKRWILEWKKSTPKVATNGSEKEHA